MREAEPPDRPRREFAQRRDGAILAALRDQLIAAPDSSMAELAASAGVGMSAIYRRFGDRGGVLRRLADDGNALFARALSDAHDALDRGEGGWVVFERFVRTSDASSLMILGALTIGTFDRTRADIDETRRLSEIGERLFSRLHDAHAIRPGLTWNDLGKLHEAIGAVRGDGPERTRLLQLRFVDIMLDGLRPELPRLADDGVETRDFYAMARRRTAH